MHAKYCGKWFKRIALLVVLSGAGGAMGMLPARAIAADPVGNSLDWVPAEADIYYSSLRMREQWQIFTRSVAWKRFREIPAVSMYWKMAEDQLADPNGPLSAVMALMELPENQQLISVVADMHSHEFVFYAGDGFSKVLQAINEVQGVRQWQKLLGEGSDDTFEIEMIDEDALEDDEVEIEDADDCDEDDELDESDVEVDEFDDEVMDEEFDLETFEHDSYSDNSQMLRTVLEMLSEDPSLLDVPDMVLAWRVEDAAALATQIKRLEVLAKLGLRGTPFGEDFKRQKLGEGDFLTLTFDGSKVDWDEQQIPGIDEEDGEFDELRQHLAKKKIVVALGTWRDYAMLAVVASPERISRLGTVPALISRKEFAPLAKAKAERLVSVGYVSEALMSANAMTAEDLNGLVDLGKVLLQDAPIPGEMVTRLHGDMETLAADLGKLITKPGALMAYSCLNDRGYEGVTYDWSQYPTLDASQPLPLTKHLGGGPLLAVVQRAKVDPDAYAAVATWIGKGVGYFEDFGLAEMDEADREKAKAYLAELKPLAARADVITREQLFPALADGQIGIALDAKIASRQWHREMPESGLPLPMFELGLAMGVSDEALLAKAIGGYKQIADDLVDTLRRLDPSSIPADYKIPEPESTQIDGQTVRFYSLPEAAGLDAQLAPSGGIANGVLVFSTSKAQVARMLNTTESTNTAGGSSTAPLAISGSFQWAATMDAVLPWVDYGIANIPGNDGQMAQAMWPQIRQGVSLLRCIKSSEWTSTLEDGALVTRSVMVMQDAE